MDLEVGGRHVLLFDDDATAAAVNAGESLVPWNQDASLLIDRFDVRHLLDRIPVRRHHLGVPEVSAPDEPSQAELDLERYLDLSSPDNRDEDEDRNASESKKDSDFAGHSSYQAVPFSYGDSFVSVDSNVPESGINSTGFHPPFPVPESLLTNLPPTEKLHHIIARTALFVSEHGGQSEIILKVKQGDNPTFGFLMPDHQLHAYYRYLVDHPKLLKDDNSSETQERKSDNQSKEADFTATGALSLLGSVYGSGEDDDGAFQADGDHVDVVKSNVAVSEIAEASSFSGDSTASKNPSAKDKTILLKRKQTISAASSSGNISKKIRDADGSGKPMASDTCLLNKKSVILEPPSFVKGLVDKIVERIRRNGKDFEAMLIEQDKTIGRFPFLLPMDQYHPYYLKILQGANEPNVSAKNPSDQKHRIKGHVGNKTDVRGLVSQHSRDDDLNLSEDLDGWSYEPQIREKFKMTIGVPKKDANDRDAKSARPSGMTTDEAAAIVMAATRGRSPADVLLNRMTDKLGTSSPGSFSSLNGTSIVAKPTSKSETDNSTGVNASESTGHLSSGHMTKFDGVVFARAIAKTTALAASSEADSSEATLTKEQKLKAERLKRAKMFAAMVKSGGQDMGELLSAIKMRSGSVEPDAVPSTHSGAESGLIHKEREGSSVPNCSEISNRSNSPSDGDTVQKHKKKQHSRSRDCVNGSDEAHRHSRKKHQSKHSSHHASRDDRKHHKNFSSKDHRHQHRHYNSSGDEYRHWKSSTTPHRHRSHDYSIVEDQKDSDSHRKKTLPQTEMKEPTKEEEIGTQASATATQVPSDLRAKVRAMLLETM